MDNLDSLSSHEAYTLKIGGDNAPDFDNNGEGLLLPHRNGKKQVLVISSLRDSDKKYTGHAHPEARDTDSLGNLKEGFNTTSHLIKIAECLQMGDSLKALSFYGQVYEFLRERVRAERALSPLDAQSLYVQIEKTLEELKQQIRNFSLENGDRIIKLGKDYLIQKSNRDFYSIVGVGENLARDLYVEDFTNNGLAVSPLILPNEFDLAFGNQDPEILLHNKEGMRLHIKLLQFQMRTRLMQLFSEHDILISGGYLPLLAAERGFSEKIGAIYAREGREAGLDMAFLIEKQYPLLDIDPNKIPKKLRKIIQPKVIERMNYKFAQEAFSEINGSASGAIAIEALQELSAFNVPTYVYNPKNLTPGNISKVSDFTPESPTGIEMVAPRKAPLILQIASSKMEQAGTSRIIEDWLAENNISFDHIGTSTRSISYTFHDRLNSDGIDLEAKFEELSAYLNTAHPSYNFSTDTKKDQVLLHFMGNDMQKPGQANRATLALTKAGINIEFISQGISQQSMIFAVPEKEAQKALLYAYRFGVQMSDADIDKILSVADPFCEDLLTHFN